MKVMLTIDDRELTAEVAEGPQVYDIATDSRRTVTQADVDRWQQMESAFGKMHVAMRDYCKSQGLPSIGAIIGRPL